MRKMVTFALFGGAVGAGIAIAKSTNATSDPAAQDEGTAMKTVGGAAAAGAFLGLLFDRRSKRRAKQVGKGAKVAVAVAGAAKAAKPKLEHAFEVGKPKFEHALEMAKPRLEQAAELTREAALSATEAARNRLAA
jgi:hypothetical protein